MFKLPMKTEAGLIKSAAEVSISMEKDGLTCSIKDDFGHQSSGLLDINIKAKAEKYKECVLWIKHIFYDMVFDQTIITDILNHIKHIEGNNRSTRSVLPTIVYLKIYKENSSMCKLNLGVSKDVLTEALEDINNGDFKTKVLPKLETFRDSLIENIAQSHAVVIEDVGKIEIPKIYQAWIDVFGENSVIDIPPLSQRSSYMSALGLKHDQKKAVIGSAETSKNGNDATLLSVRTALNSGFDHEDYPAVVLANKFFFETILQLARKPQHRFFFRCFPIFTVNAEANHSELVLQAETANAYQVVKKIVLDLATRQSSIDVKMGDGARDSCVKEELQTIGSSECQAVSSYFSLIGKRISLGQIGSIMEKMTQVDEEKLIEVINKYFAPLFDPERASIFVAAPHVDVQKSTEFLKALGYNVELIS